MTCVSGAEACRRLGIDAKTLRRWLADAQLPLQAHPHDGRKKGLSGEHLHALARLHQRSLAPFPQELPASLADEMPELSTALLALPERLGALQAQIASLIHESFRARSSGKWRWPMDGVITQGFGCTSYPFEQAQIAALQQQVAELPHLLQQHGSGLALSAAPTQQTRTIRRPPKPAPPASRARPAAKPPRKPAHVIPRVEYVSEGHYVVICPKQGLLPFEPDTPEWFAWVAKQSAFRFVGKGGSFSAHHEWRVPRGAWRAHRHIRNHNYILPLAPNQELTIAVLEQAAAALQAHLT